MPSDNLLNLFPQRKIHPYDGMPITAEVWDEAHAYHERVQSSHNLFFHGAGILAGMEVVASDPPDQLVYILSGAAVDPTGQLIVLSEPVAYELGNDTDGVLYLTICYRQSITSSPHTQSGGSPEYTEAQFLITASPSLPGGPVVELARIKRENRTAPVQDAQEALHPRANEIDLRFRRLIPVRPEPLVSAAVVYLGDGKAKGLGAGLSRMVGEIHHCSQINLVVDDDVELSPEVLGYTLICLAGKGNFQIKAAQLKGLKGYLERGGTLLMEYEDEGARSCFMEFCKQAQVEPKSLPRIHPILIQPYLFLSPPAGNTSGEILAAEGLLLSGQQYGKPWGAESDGQPQTREQIRSLVEWAVNILTYATERRRTG